MLMSVLHFIYHHQNHIFKCMKWPTNKHKKWEREIWPNTPYDDQVLNFIIFKWTQLFLMSPLCTQIKLISDGHCQAVVPQNYRFTVCKYQTMVKLPMHRTLQTYSFLPLGRCVFLLLRTADTSNEPNTFTFFSFFWCSPAFYLPVSYSI